MIYEPFDDFLRIESWYSRHPYDLRRFHEALSKVISERDFHPEEMGSHFRAKVPKHHHDVVDRYVGDAWAVKHWLEATK